MKLFFEMTIFLSIAMAWREPRMQLRLTLHPLGPSQNPILVLSKLAAATFDFPTLTARAHFGNLEVPNLD